MLLAKPGEAADARCSPELEFLNELLKNRAREAALVALDTAGRIGQLESCLALRIIPYSNTVLLVGREAREAEYGDPDVVGALVWQEVTVMRAAEPVNEVDPPPAIFLEFLQLCGIDDIADIAGDH